jgi:hypothetical protein
MFGGLPGAGFGGVFVAIVFGSIVAARSDGNSGRFSISFVGAVFFWQAPSMSREATPMLMSVELYLMRGMISLSQQIDNVFG